MIADAIFMILFFCYLCLLSAPAMSWVSIPQMLGL